MEEVEEVAKQERMWKAEREEFQTRVSQAEREELDSLRRKRAMYETAEREFAKLRDGENESSAEEETLTTEVVLVTDMCAKLRSHVGYLEGNKTDNKQEHKRYRAELEAEKTRIEQAVVDLNVVEQQQRSQMKDNDILHEEKMNLLSENEALQTEKTLLLEEKQNLRSRLLQATQKNANLKREVEALRKR